MLPLAEGQQSAKTIAGEHAESIYLNLMQDHQGVIPALPKGPKGRVKKIKDFFDAMATAKEKEDLKGSMERGERSDVVRHLQDLVRARFAKRYRELHPRKQVCACIHVSSCVVLCMHTHVLI